jgi:hypothetical protein
MLPYTPADMMFLITHRQAFVAGAALAVSVSPCQTERGRELGTDNAYVLAGRHAR